ncbi:NAD(P)/FAD-dependent oxidoreductase [Paenibacillus septentrionalis]|uniref:Ferredoxin--NADP reductase n=1 Tax=Paenibacillus septentrionalis TaxID=429342 RepID=A0ABW1V882_9BACL
MKDVYDVTIIGGGPSGLYSAFYAGLRDLKTKLIEFQPHLGGKVHIYPEKFIWDVGGLPATPGHQLIENLVKQGLTFHPTVLLNTKVEHISKQDDCYVLTTQTGELHYSKTVIVAVGGGIIKPMKLELEGAEKFEMSNLHYTVRGIQRFQDKRVLISGGGNAAIDWACDLLEVAAHITVVYRGEELPAHEAHVKKLKDHGVPIYTHSQIKALVAHPNRSEIAEVVVENQQTQSLMTVQPDEVLINHGYNRDHSLSYDQDIEPERDEAYNYYIMTNPKCESSAPGLYAVGDAVEYNGKVHLIAGAFQDAVNAVNSAKRYIEPEALEYGMVSSHNEHFKAKNKELIKQALKDKQPQ